MQFTNYELLFITQVTSYFLHTSKELYTNYEFEMRIANCLNTSYELLFIAQVPSYFLHTSYKILLIARVTSYFLDASYELLFIARVGIIMLIV